MIAQPPPPPAWFLATSRVLHATFFCLFVCFLLFSNLWQKILFLTQSILFPFDPKCQKKTRSALDPAGSTRRSLLFDRDLYLWICCSCCCGFVVDFQQPFAVKSQVWLENKLSLLPCYFVAFTWMQCSTDRGGRKHSELRLGSQVTDQNNLHCIHLGTSWPMVSSNFIFHIWLESFQ